MVGNAHPTNWKTSAAERVDILIVIADREYGQLAVRVLARAIGQGGDQVVLSGVDVLIFVYQYEGVPRQQPIAQLVGFHAGRDWERQPDGTYRGWISEFDAGVGPFAHRRDAARFNQAMQNRIKQEYAYQVIERQQRAHGRSVSRQRLPGGEIEVLIEGYR